MGSVSSTGFFSLFPVPCSLKSSNLYLTAIANRCIIVVVYYFFE
ncbi:MULTISPECIES: hypothetical protein [unclassified Moorena]|nr:MULTISPECIES: hypothetical protein [unclassified Moorena]